MLALTLSNLVWDGLGREWFWRNAPLVNRSSLVACDALAALLAVRFTIVYLSLPTGFAWLRWSLWAVIGASASALLLAAPPTWSIGYALIDAVSVIGPLVLLAAGVAAALHGDRPARWYLVAMVILLAGISAASAAALVFAEPPSWTESAPRLGAILMEIGRAHV